MLLLQRKLDAVNIATSYKGQEYHDEGRFGGSQVPDDEDRDSPQHVGAPDALVTAGSAMLTGGP
jgi:hypothetical protein